MIRIRLINEGRVVKQITSRLHEGVVLEQIKKYSDPYDTIQIVEGELSEGAKDMLHHVAKKIVPAALAAGMALGGASNAQAQGGANPHYPGLNHSVGQQMSDIFSPNYKELRRQREYNRSTERQVWNAEQDQLRKQRVADARAQADAGKPTVHHHVVYDQSRMSQDGKSYIIYGMDNKVRRIPVAGTEFMPADSQRLGHYITSTGSVFYVRHPHVKDGIREGYTVTRGIDKERYQERPGLEGPFSTRSGKVVYYDPKEGKYYDPETDFYIGHEDYAKMDEGVAESLPLNDALKVLRQYGAENLKTTTNELHFYKNGKAFSVPLTFNDDATRSVPLSSLNSATRGLKGQGVSESDPNATVGTIPSTGTSGGTGRTQFAPTGKTTNAKFNKNGQIELDTEQEDDGSVNLDADAVNQLQQAGVKIKEEDGHSPVAYALTRRIMTQRLDLLKEFGPALVSQAIDEVADFVGDVEEIGSSDVSGWVKHVEQMLRDNPPEAFGEGLTEGSDTLEGILSKYSADYAKFKAGGDIDENQDFFQDLFDYYTASGELPHRGDPYEWITQELSQESGVAPVVEAEEDEATPGDQASADQNIIMQIRKASDYEKPTRIELADGTESVIAPNIARQLLAKFEKMKPESKALLQNTLNTEEGFKEILNYFGGGVREQAASRAGNIIQMALEHAGLSEGLLDDVRARMDARRNPPAKPAANLPTTPRPPVPPYEAPVAPAELKAGDIIGYRMPGAKMVPTKAKVLKLMSNDMAMVSVSSPRLIAQNNGSPVITIGPLKSLEIQNPYKELSTKPPVADANAPVAVMKEADEDWLVPYNMLLKNDGEPSQSDPTRASLNWKKSMALAAKEINLVGQPLVDFIVDHANAGVNASYSSAVDQAQRKLYNEILSLVQQAPTMDEMRAAVKQQAAGVHQQNLTNIQNQLDLENAPLQHELSVQALLNKAELDRADQKELLELDMEARLAIVKVKQELELDAKERLTQIEREIEDRKEREDIRKHELELAQAGYKHEIAVINATAEGEYKKAKLEADYQIQIKQLDNIDNASERQNKLDQINTEKAKELAVIDAETKAKVTVLQKEVDVEKQQSDIKIEQAFMMTFNPIWGAAITAAHAAGATWDAGIENIKKALSMLAKPIMPTAQKESRYDRRDAYQRDYDSSVAGMGKRQSYAYQQDGGANDEGWDRPEYQAPQHTYYIRFKDSGKVYKQKGMPKSFANKSAANAYALAMARNNPAQQGNLLLSVSSEDKPAA